MNGVIGVQPAEHRDLTVITSDMRGHLAKVLDAAFNG